jgi:hypothetical protein
MPFRVGRDDFRPALRAYQFGQHLFQLAVLPQMRQSKIWPCCFMVGKGGKIAMAWKQAKSP